MTGLAYLFERFPSFTQTFCYREIAELNRQEISPAIFSIRSVEGEPPQDWDARIAQSVHYLPNENEIVKEVEQLRRKGKLPETAVRSLDEWGRKTDFLRLHQAAYLGPRLQTLGVYHVHAHFAGMAARTAFWLQRFFGITYSFTAHAHDIFAPKKFTISLGDLIGGASAVVTVSDFSARFLQERFRADAAKVHRVYNGIDLARFRVSNFSATPPLLLSVGRLIAKKGFADLIEACRLLRDRGVNFRCEIIGDGPLEMGLLGQISDAGLSGAAFLRGPKPQSEIVDRLAAATLFVLPCATDADGSMDNLPTVIMEAMASGLPVISTAIAGVPEMVEHDATGLLVPEKNPGALAAAIERVLSEVELARAFGKRGRAAAEERFSIQSNVSALVTIFERAAG